MHQRFLSSWAGVLLMLTASLASAQGFATKPVRWIVPFAAGGGQDVIARIIGQQLSVDIGQPVVIDNKPGANGAIAARELMKAAPDGHTLLSVSNGHMVLNPLLVKQLGYDPAKDFALVSTTGRIPLVLIAGPALEAKTFQEFIAAAKAAPGKYNFASFGSGTPHHVAMELIKMRTRTFIVPIPYRGGAPAVTAVAGGEVPVMMADLAFAGGLIKAGKVRALAVTDSKRLAQLPDVPTLAEVGLPDAVSVPFTGVVTVAGTPPAVIRAMSQAIAKAVATPEVARKLNDASVEPNSATPEAFAALIQNDFKLWREVIQTQKITAE